MFYSYHTTSENHNVLERKLIKFVVIFCNYIPIYMFLSNMNMIKEMSVIFLLLLSVNKGAD